MEFATEEEAKKVAAMDLEFEGTKLDMMMKLAYMDMKCEEKKGEVKAYPAKRKFKFNAFKEMIHNPRGNPKRHQPNHAKTGAKSETGTSACAVVNAQAGVQVKVEELTETETATVMVPMRKYKQPPTILPQRQNKKMQSNDNDEE